MLRLHKPIKSKIMLTLNVRVKNAKTNQELDTITLGYSESVEKAKMQYCENTGYKLFEIKFEFID